MVRADADQNIFDTQVAPLLARHCLSCHDTSNREGELDLSRQQSARQGGASGPVIVPKDLAGSLLWKRVDADEMPPETPLSDAEKSVLREWVRNGAIWGTQKIDPFRWSTPDRAGYDWWSLQPLTNPQIPKANSKWVQNAIDRFIWAKLQTEQLEPSPPADRRTLIRRLSFDLLGLPPSRREVEEFVSDPAPDAYDRLVDRFLASPRYGERWARHWLDIVRYGESQGFERDKLRPNSWPYRDWIIEALNSDLPYDEFVRLQLAGDVIAPDDAQAIAATGFLVAGAYDEVGQSQQSAAMRAVVRQDELEDIVGTVGQTFLGLTVNCARCHEHKFDPISQREYYQLSAALAGVRHGDRKILTSRMRDRIAQLESAQQALTREMEAIEAPIRKALIDEKQLPAQIDATTDLPRPMARWSFDDKLRDAIGSLHGTAHGTARVEDGRLILDGKTAYVSTGPLVSSLQEKTLEVWVEPADLDQRGGGVMSVQTTDGVVFDAIVFGEKEPRRWMAGSNGFTRTQSWNGPHEDLANRQPVHIVIVYGTDGQISAYRNGAPYGTPYSVEGSPVAFAAQQSQILFGLRHGTAAGGNRTFAGAIDLAQLYDRALTAAEVRASFFASPVVTPEDIAARLSPAERQSISALQGQLADVVEALAALRDRKIYSVVPREPEPTHLLIRGNPASPNDVVVPAGIASVPGLSPDFGLRSDAPDAERRRRFADWITAESNPLFSRVIVNRLWQFHFGRGLVRTPNDFGFNGGQPSHPELLDSLARSLVEHDWSLKRIQRQIVTSATYRQRSRETDQGRAIDVGNRWLWRFSPRRLEAEVLRDTILAVSGELNDAIGGPPYQDFKTFAFNSQFYEMIDPVDYVAQRRTIYRTWLRSGRSSLLDVFDCPDPSTTVPQRAVTTTPSQALALLNNSFVLRMAEKLARRVEPFPIPEQITSLYERLYQRRPDDRERSLATQFVEQHGVLALCRVLFNSNEFLYVD